MKLSRSDYYLMRWSILAVCVSSLASAILLYSSGEYAESARSDLRNAQDRLTGARNRLAGAFQDRENMAVYAGEYGALIERNIIGDDQRLEWMEGLENIRRENRVTGFRYSIAPQKNFVSQPPIDSGNFDIRYSEMKLQFDLLHEAQLLDFFDALRAGIKGWYLLENCALQRSAATPGEDSGSPVAGASLRAECGGGWITLKSRSSR